VSYKTLSTDCLQGCKRVIGLNVILDFELRQILAVDGSTDCHLGQILKKHDEIENNQDGRDALAMLAVFTACDELHIIASGFDENCN